MSLQDVGDELVRRGAALALTTRKCIILLLGSDGKLRAVMEDDDDYDPPAGAAWSLPAMRVFEDANEAFLYASKSNIKTTFQIVEIEDME